MANHRVKLIVNPNADLGRAWHGAADLRSLVQELGGADWAGTVYPTHGVELARQAAEEGYELVIAAGGDGTAHEVVNGLMQVPAERRPNLGVIPLGSGNDFSYTIGIDRRPEIAIRQVMSGQPKKIDIGRFWYGQGKDEFFVNAIGIGFDTTVTIRSRRITLLRGFLIYLVAVMQTILFNHEAPRMSIKTDREEWIDELLMIVMCNGGREGGGFNVSVLAKPDDGILNYTAVRKVPRLKMLSLVPKFMNGTMTGHRDVRMGEFNKLEIKSDRPLYIHSDGEIIAGWGMDVRDFGVEIIRDGLFVVV